MLLTVEQCSKLSKINKDILSKQLKNNCGFIDYIDFLDYCKYHGIKLPEFKGDIL